MSFGKAAVALLLILASVMALSSSYQLAGRGHNCDEQKDTVLLHCNMSIKNHSPIQHPSEICCFAVKRSDMECVVRFIDDDDKKGIDMGRVDLLTTECQLSGPAK